MTTELRDQVIDEITADGPMPFDRFVERALYDRDQGFYAVHGQAGGRRGDFVTSVEVGPLFAAVIADWLDARWRESGEPKEFRVSEAGAGVGTLFRGINRAAPRCFEALSYTLVERSASMRGAHQSLPSGQWRSAADLPAEPQHVIVANELLDNLAFGIAERVGDGWAPVHVIVDGGALAVAAGSPDSSLGYLDDLVTDAAPGTRVPTAAEGRAWVSRARQLADRVLVFDYGATTAELAVRGVDGWLRTYVGHERGSDPVADVGRRDITHDVPFDQLPPGAGQSTQADWLTRHGMLERIEHARRAWAERGHIGDLDAMVARSAIGEAEALTDATGLGGFTALEWRR